MYTYGVYIYIYFIHRYVYIYILYISHIIIIPYHVLFCQIQPGSPPPAPFVLAHAELVPPPAAIHVAQRRHDGVFLAAFNGDLNNDSYDVYSL